MSHPVSQQQNQHLNIIEQVEKLKFCSNQELQVKKLHWCSFPGVFNFQVHAAELK